MAEVSRSLTWPLAAAVLLMGVAQTVNAQAAVSDTNGATGSIAGRLTDLRSTPVDGAQVVVRNEATGAEARAITQKNGGFSFSGLQAGSYTVEAESERLGRGQVAGVFVAAGHQTRVQTAMRFELPPSEPVQAAVHETPQKTLPANTSLAAQPLRQPAILDELGEKHPSGAKAPIGFAGLAARLKPCPDTSCHSNKVFPQPVKPPPPSAVRQDIAAVQPKTVGVALDSAVTEHQQSWTVGWNLAIDAAAAGAVQAANELSRPHPKRIQAARQEIEPVTPAVTTTLSGAEIQALPASGRHWQDFALDTPAAATAAGGTSQISLRGAGELPAETTIDGASMRLAFGGQGGEGPGNSGPGLNGQGGREQNGMGRSWSGGRGLMIAEAAIREVETAAGNAEADSARSAGGLLSVETQSGANGLHGQGFFFDRQNSWGAQNPFTQWITQTAPATLTSVPVFGNGPNGAPQPYTPPDHETTWGIGLGGSIKHNKLFWFGALDSYHRNDPGVAMVKWPYLAERVSGCTIGPCTETTGFFAQPTNDQMQVLSARLGLSGVNPIAEGLAAYSSMLETLDGLLGPAPRTAAQWVGFGRIDWQAGERHHITLEGIGADWNSPGGGLTRVSETYGNHSFGSSQASQEWLLGRWEAYITPNLLAVTQGSVGHAVQSARPETPSAFEQTFLAPNTYGQLPQIDVDSRYGFIIGNPSRFGQGSYPDERIIQVQESLDWVHGSLLVRSGFELSHNYDATTLLRNQTGTYNYSSVENFASDALAFAAFGLSGELNPFNQHNCDQTGKVWRDSGNTLRGLGALPCYSYYSQTMGPTNWFLSTNDWAGYSTAQWQPSKHFVLSAGLRWELEQMPPPLARLANPELALTQKLPSLGNDWGPRVSLAWGNSQGHWPVLRMGYGMYYARTENATLLTALTQTGSLNGDLNFFIRPTDGYNSATGTSGAPPFPYVLAGEPLSLIKPGVVEFAPRFRNPEVHQAVVAVEETLPGHVVVTASAMASLGRRLPISIDTNFDPAVNPQTITYAVVDGTGKGPIKTPTITVPFYASWPTGDCPGGSPLNISGQCGRANPDYQQITQIESRANSTYEAASIKLVRYGRRGLSLHAHYTYSHAMDWNPNESTLVAGNDVLDPANFKQEYGTSNLDIRHSAAVMVVYETPWKLRGVAGRMANGWMISGIGQYHSGLPYTMRTSGSLAKEFDASGTAIVGLGPGMNGSGGDNRVYGVGRNTFRYPATWKADLRLGKSFDLGEMRKLELMAESFNLFNHQNVTELETNGYYIESGSTNSLPTLNFLNGLKTGTTAFGQPLNVNATNFYRERQIQVGLRMRF